MGFQFEFNYYYIGFAVRVWNGDKEPVAILQHDFVFWFGDLNYRITAVPADVVKELIKAGKYVSLVPADQLAEERAAGNVFVDFSEAPINFPPTYKYKPGTDSLENKKMQTPAWCDRILYKTMDPSDNSSVTPLTYTSCPEIKVSDHKPVRATYEVQVRVVDEAARQEVHRTILRTLDVLENSIRPDVTVSPIEFDFPEVRYKQTQALTCDIRNTGQVVAQFHIVPKPGCTEVFPKWMKVVPSSGLISPGQKATLEISITTDNYAVVCSLNEGLLGADATHCIARS